MDDLLKHPRCTADDLGRPLPDSPHAVSVCLPLWRHNIGYEEADPAVVDRMQCGYPRFFLHPEAARLFGDCERRFARGDQCCFAFPSRRVAERCATFVRRTTGESSAVHDFGRGGIHALCLPRSARAAATSFWQHTGEIVSSRQAVAALCDGSPRSATGDVAAAAKLRQRVAELAGALADDVLLFPNGMAAMFCAYRAISKLWPGRKSVQFGFPYVDALKIQEKFGAGVHLFARGDASELGALSTLLGGSHRTLLPLREGPAEGQDARRSNPPPNSSQAPIMALVCEFPSNPLLNCPDLARLDQLSQQFRFPLVVDDTLSACINTNLLPACDVLVTSLTKFFSGAGDVMGGSLILNPARPLYDRLKTALADEFEDLVFAEDAAVLERNSRDVVERVRRINRTTEELCETIRRHPSVERVDYPKYNTPEFYSAYLREGGGFGGLFSIQLHNAAERAPRVYDALRICKGPNLGTNFSICCPYTILAHYNELEFAQRCGISPYLLRVSVGLEDVDWLKSRFREALDVG